MKSDLDALMQARDLDALLVVGPGRHNPAMVYLTGGQGAHLTDAILVKKRGEPPVLFHRTMERDEAARTGLRCRDLDSYRLDDLVKQMGGSSLGGVVERYRLILHDLDLTSGRVAISGRFDAGMAFAIFSGLQERLPELSLAGEVGEAALLAAMATKDPDEVERIRRMGKTCAAVIAQTADFLAGQRVKDQTLVGPDGEPVRIGEVKRLINRWLAEDEAENPMGTILAIGHDAGVPHSTGKDGDPLRLGQTIILDMFPCEPGGGYHYDITRTWCLGYAPDEALRLYEDVLAAYRQASGALRLGKPCRSYQEMTCQLFQARGHPTIQEDPGTTDGYVHSLGHGLGLHVHERPSFRLSASEDERLEANMVVTVEPGLYYPERGLGVRLEDTFWMRPDGTAEVLADYPLDLVISMVNSQ
jgi:Xaa-Pro aminopeptidase